MNILYISRININQDVGLFWSVPNQVKSQSEFDNVFWFNAMPLTCQYWESTGLYHCMIDYPHYKISEFPSPFNIPDLVVFEGFYAPLYSLIYEVIKSKFNYIIIPRGSLTKMGQRKHHFKKILGNILFWSYYTHKAKAIHYLTANEALSSGLKWNMNQIIIPNGVVEISEKQWHLKSNIDSFHGVFVGRFSVFHKGIDLLVDACISIKRQLKDNNFKIDMYGPDREHDRDRVMKIISENCLDDVLIVHDHPIFGAEKEEILLQSDFFVLTSRLEGHPMGLIEALSYGLPCIVTRGSNMFDEITDYNAGWTAENSSTSIAMAILNLISDHDKFPEKSKNALALAKMYSWRSIAEATHTKYKSLLNV